MRHLQKALALFVILGPTLAAAQPGDRAGAAQPARAGQTLHLPLLAGVSPIEGGPDRSADQWTTAEWSVLNPSFQGNPFDLVASATFTHAESGEQRTTGLYYAGDDRWAFRFTPTRPGRWTYTTASDDRDLSGLRGTVTARPADGNGFVGSDGSKWVHTGSGRAFVPQYVMAPAIELLDEAWLDRNIPLFLDEHGFSGFHVTVQCRWFDLEAESCAGLGAPNPDPATFERLERLITRTYAAGGVVHIWMWGDAQRNQTPVQWGLNGSVDRRLQRYLAARLGPLPGWSMGYGFDLWEWVDGDQLARWRSYLDGQMGWEHPLGARSATNQLSQLSEEMDYASYEQHRPSLETYLKTIATRPGKPAFSEDRFRVRDGSLAKDYSFDDTRRGLWHSAMAGGVANIWGNLAGGRNISLGSAAYPNAAQIKTYSRFFAERFDVAMAPCGARSDGACLGAAAEGRMLFYREGATSIRLDLRGLPGELRAVAVDTRRPYAEIDLGPLAATSQVWQAPYSSDWAIAVGE